MTQIVIDRKIRRELRRKLGTRVQRRAGVKSHGKAAPRQHLAKLIETYKRSQQEAQGMAKQTKLAERVAALEREVAIRDKRISLALYVLSPSRKHSDLSKDVAEARAILEGRG